MLAFYISFKTIFLPGTFLSFKTINIAQMKKNINCPDGKNRSFHTIVFIFPISLNLSSGITAFTPMLPGEREKN
jgi:hypothetical protein